MRNGVFSLNKMCVCVCVFPIPMSVSFSLYLLKVQHIQEWSRKRQDPDVSLPVFNICALRILPSKTVSLKTPCKGACEKMGGTIFVFSFIIDFLFVLYMSFSYRLGMLVEENVM